MSRKKTPEQYVKECKEKGYDPPIEDYVNAKTRIKHRCSKGHIYEQTPNSHLNGQGCSVCNGKQKKTPEEYAQECKEKGYDPPIEDYINNKTMINHKCSKGHIYLQRPADHLRGIGCSVCYGNKKKTPEEYVQECKDKGYDSPIEDYIDANTKINHRCSKGHIYPQRPADHLRGVGCKQCADSAMRYTRRKFPEQYAQECKEKGYDPPIEDYSTKNIKIKHKCNKGHIYEQRPSSHLHGDGCSVCAHNNKKTPEQYIKECKNKGQDLPIEDYVNDRTKIKHRCSKGHVYEQSPGSHLQGQGCPICSGKQKKTPEQYIKECKDKGQDLPIEDYKGNKIKIKHKCSKGHIYEQAPDMHVGKYKTGCPICKESHGERFIRNYLDKNNISYIPQKTFNDLKDKDYLSYDFYLPDYNILIEYQGIQHYESVSFDGKTYTDLDKQQHHDNLKRNYAKDNGYRLLELHYSLDTQDKVDKYLKRRIK